MRKALASKHIGGDVTCDVAAGVQKAERCVLHRVKGVVLEAFDAAGGACEASTGTANHVMCISAQLAPGGTTSPGTYRRSS
jgi:hypothetical protein